MHTNWIRDLIWGSAIRWPDYVYTLRCLAYNNKNPSTSYIYVAIPMTAGSITYTLHVSYIAI